MTSAKEYIQSVFETVKARNVFLGLTVMAKYKSTVVIVFNLTQLLDHIKADFVSTQL